MGSGIRDQGSGIRDQEGAIFQPPTPNPQPPAVPDLAWDADGLVPVVTQDADTGAVLILAFMNRAALVATLATGQVHFWSRSRQALWRKGEQSGHTQILTALHVNCEHNSLLLKVRSQGPACHTGYVTCFYRRLLPDGTLAVEGERAFDPATVYHE